MKGDLWLWYPIQEQKLADFVHGISLLGVMIEGRDGESVSSCASVKTSLSLFCFVFLGRSRAGLNFAVIENGTLRNEERAQYRLYWAFLT
jgi:hypothetical protein